MAKNMEKKMETGVIDGLYRDPSVQIIPTLALQSVILPTLGYLDP